MVDVRFSNAAQAYQNKPTADPTSGLAKEVTSGDSFSDMVKSAGEGAVQALEVGEQMSMKGVQGTADLSDVVTAVSQAEVTLQTVISIRDTMVDSYRRIMQMPI